MRQARGDTIVEVMVAFAIFALLAVGTISIMNRGTQTAERALEVTLVREQIDAQANMLRYVRDAVSSDATVWQNITSGSRVTTQSVNPCPAATQNALPTKTTLPAQAFVLNANGGKVEVRDVSDIWQQPNTHSQVTLGSSPVAKGVWIVATPAEGTSVKAYDFQIRACWYTVGDSKPVTLGTIVRLYEK